MDKKNISISAFFPCYNDAGTIGNMVESVFEVLGRICDDYEVLVVDDCSSDNSRDVLEELKKKYSNLKLIYHKKNRGYGGALRSGFQGSTKDYVFYTDGDAQYNPQELEKLVVKLDEGIDVVNGYKIKRNDPLYRVIIGSLYNRLMKFMFAIKISDVDCDFRLIKRAVFGKIKLEHNSGIICVEMIKKMQNAGCSFSEVGVSHYYRSYGRSQFFNFNRIFKVGLSILKLWWQFIFCKNFLDKVSGNNFIFNTLRRILENDFKSQKNIIKKEFNLSDSIKILDIGCGTGMLAPLFNSEHYTGIDVSQGYIDYAKKKYKGTFEVMDATRLRFEDSSFNNVLISGVLHHLPDETARAVLNEVRRVLTNDGRMLIFEDIPTPSSFNIFGRIMHYFDRGEYIRPVEQYRNLLSEVFFVEKTYLTRSGICDYGVFILRKDEK